MHEPKLQKRLDVALEFGTISVSDDPATLAPCDTLIIAVGTPLGDDFRADTSHLEAACAAVKPHLAPGVLAILKSTVPPGTTRNIVAAALEGLDADVAFCPERLAEGRAVDEFERIPIVVGGVTDRATQRAGAFWRDVMNLEVIEVDSAESAELVKLADNLWIDVNIALATEIARIAAEIGADAHDVIRAANSLPKGEHHVNILTPSVGVGGYCLTKDPWFVHTLGRELGVEVVLPSTARHVNDATPAYYAGVIDRLLREECGCDPQGNAVKVAVLGLAFKSDTGDVRYTPSKVYIETLLGHGYEVAVHDPLVSAHDAADTIDIPLIDDLDDALCGADAVLFLTAHREFVGIPLERIASLVKPGALIFDGQRQFTRDQAEAIRTFGLRFRGIGRA